MLRSATFAIGIVLAGLAFGGFLILGGLMAPPPYSVVIALDDIPAYTRIDESVLGLDAQHVNSQVAHTLILREEVDQYLGGFVVENIHAGEPLRKSAIIAPNNPAAANRLALILSDPNQVVMVIPVDAKNAPAQLAPTDRVDLIIGLATGVLPNTGTSTFSNLIATPTPFSSVAFPTNPTPGRPAALPTAAAPVISVPQNLFPGDMNLPASKIVLDNVPIVAVRFQQIPNPAFANASLNFTNGDQNSRTSVPAYVKGDIESVTVLITRASAELVTWAMDNGRVHLALRSPLAVDTAAHDPTLGVTFNDFLLWMMRERVQVSGLQVFATPTTATTTSPATPPTATPRALEPKPTSRARSAQPTSVAGPEIPITTANSSADALLGVLIPCGAGFVVLIILVLGIRFIRSRRRDSAL
ncbi:MAG: hypothetical protein HY327_02825 [Chloroflexi bacterium]|nr:hypothetical protein [Chloroflexota bacterium]